MRENTVRNIWHSGGAVINGWLTIPSPWSAELMAHQGWDSLTIDTQHGLIGYDAALPMLQAISTTPVMPLARAPWNEPVGIMKLLDAGAMGIICPMVNSVKEAQAFVGACRYAPLGYRSAGPTRAGLYGGSNYLQEANTSVITFAMIETAQAVKNVDDILSTPGLDATYVGPTDLAISLGLRPGGPLDEPTLDEAIQKIVKSCKQHGIIAGIHTSSTSDAIRCIERGFQFVTLLSDTRFLADASSAAVRAIRAGHVTPSAAGTPY